MNHDHGVMIHYEKYNQQVYIQIRKFILITNSWHSYMFWPHIVAIFREVFIKDLLHRISCSCLTFYVIHPSITPPSRWPQYTYVEYQTVV
jgi:hypothetical protein